MKGASWSSAAVINITVARRNQKKSPVVAASKIANNLVYCVYLHKVSTCIIRLYKKILLKIFIAFILQKKGAKVGAQYLDKPPSMDEFSDLISKARKQAQKVGMKHSDIKAAILKVRAKK